MLRHVSYRSIREASGVSGRADHLVASLQVLHFVGKLLGFAVALVLQFLHLPLDLLIQMLQLLDVVLKLLQQPTHTGGKAKHVHRLDFEIVVPVGSTVNEGLRFGGVGNTGLNLSH